MLQAYPAFDVQQLNLAGVKGARGHGDNTAWRTTWNFIRSANACQTSRINPQLVANGSYGSRYLPRGNWEMSAGISSGGIWQIQTVTILETCSAVNDPTATSNLLDLFYMMDFLFKHTRDCYTVVRTDIFGCIFHVLAGTKSEILKQRIYWDFICWADVICCH